MGNVIRSEARGDIGHRADLNVGIAAMCDATNEKARLVPGLLQTQFAYLGISVDCGAAQVNPRISAFNGCGLQGYAGAHWLR